MTFAIFAQSDEKTWHDQQKDNYKDKDNDKYIWRTPQSAVFETCDLWDIFLLSDEKTLSGQQKDNDKDKDNDKYIQLR